MKWGILAGEPRARETSSEEASSSRGTGSALLSEDFQKAALESEERSSHGAAAAHRFHSETDLLRHAAELPESRTSVPAAGNVQMEKGLSAKAREPLPPRPPDFSAASEGLAEPVFAPGTLHPPTELRQRVVEKSSSEKEGEKGLPGVANGERSQRSRSESNPSTSADEHGTPPPYKMRLGTFATPQMKDWERLMADNSQCQSLRLRSEC